MTTLGFDDEDFSANLTIGSEFPYPLNTMIENLSNNEYHNILGVSSTQFKLMRLSNTVFDNRKFFRVDNPVFSLGNLIHDAILLPHLVDDNYIECSTKGMDTVSYYKQKEDNPDKTVCGQGDIQKAKDIASLVKLIYGKFLSPKNTKKEVSFFHQDEDSGMIFRIRPDIYNEKIGMLMDIKSTKANSHKEFEKLIEEYDYDLSIAFYFDVLLMCGYNVLQNRTGWICVPKSEPHAPFSFIVSEELLEKGRSKYQTLLEEYIEFKELERTVGSDDVGLTFDDVFSKVAHSWAYRKENY